MRHLALPVVAVAVHRALTVATAAAAARPVPAAVGWVVAALAAAVRARRAHHII